MSFLLLLFSSVFSMASVEECGNNSLPISIHPDSTVCAMLGPTLSDVLFNSHKVTCYTLKGKRDVDLGEFQVESHWVRDSLIGRLSPQMIGVLQFALVANGENYKDDSLRIKAPYAPMLEFEFQKKKEVVHVLVSTSDHTWTIMYEGERWLNFNYHDCELLKRFFDMFVKPDE